MVVDGWENEIALLSEEVSIKTVSTTTDAPNDGVTAGVRHKMIVSDFHKLLQQADTARRSDWLAINDAKKDPVIEMAMFPVRTVAKPDAVLLKKPLEEIGAGYEKNKL
jgi:hypothetical protein